MIRTGHLLLGLLLLASIPSIGETISDSSVHRESFTQEVTSKNTTPTGNSENNSVSSENPKRRRFLRINSVVLGVIVLAYCGAFFYTNQRKTVEDNSQY